jgi:hypothetical protein
LDPQDDDRGGRSCSGHLARLALRRGLVFVATGLAVGLAGAQLLTRQLTGMLYGVTPEKIG